MIDDIVLQLRRAGDKTFLLPFGDAVAAVVSSDQAPGKVRVAAEIDSIEKSLRQTAKEIDNLLACASRTAAEHGAGHRHEADETKLTEGDLNFLTEIADILPSISDSLLECSDCCRTGALSLEEIAARVTTAALIVSRGTARFLPGSVAER